MKIYVIICVIIFTLSGCLDSDTRGNVKTEHQEKGSIAGHITVPVSSVGTNGKMTTVPVDVPLILSFERTVSENADSTEKRQTTIDATALGKTIGDAVNIGMRQMIPALSPLLSSPGNGGDSGTEKIIAGVLGLTTTAAGVYGVMKRNHANDLKRQLDTSKASEDEAWTAIKDRALDKTERSI